MVITHAFLTGHAYITKPAGALFFPARQRTRAQERAARIHWERGINEARIAAEAAAHAERPAANADPPPF